MAKTMICEVVNRTLVVVHNEQPVDDQEWTDFTQLFIHGDFYGMLVWTPKTGPNASQRALQRRALESRDQTTPVAVMTDSPVARAVIALFAVFLGERIRGFSSTDFEGAFKHVAIRDDERVTILIAC